MMPQTASVMPTENAESVKKPAQETQESKPVAPSKARREKPDRISMAEPLSAEEQPLYWILQAGLARQRDMPELSAQAYLKALHLKADPELAREATIAALDAGNMELAGQAAEKWLRLDPKAADAYRVRAMILLHQNNPDAAALALKSAFNLDETPGKSMLELESSLLAESGKSPQQVLQLTRNLRKFYPKMPEAHYLHALIALNVGNDEEAAQAAEIAASLNPEWLQAYLLQTDALFSAGNIDAALAVFDKLIELRGETPQILMSKGRILKEAGLNEQAEELWVQILTQQPDNFEAHYEIAMLAWKQGDLDKMRDHLEPLIANEKTRNTGLYFLGRLAEKEEDQQRALKYYQEINRGRYFVDAQLRIAKTWIKLNETPRARQHLSELRARFPQLAMNLYLVEGQLLEQDGELDEAYSIYTEALSEPSGDIAPILYARALLAERIGNISQAAADFEALLDQEPENPVLLNAYGYTLAENNLKLDKALEYILKAYALEPDNPAIHDSLGWVYYRLGRMDEAEKWLRKAFSSFEDPEVAAHFGEVLWVQGKRDEAREVWQKAMELSSGNDILRKTMERLAP